MSLLTWTQETGGTGGVSGSVQLAPVVAQEIKATNDVLPLSIRLFASSTVDMQRWLDDGGNIVLRVASTGELAGVSPKGPLISKVRGGAASTNGHAVPNVADDTFTLNAATQTLTNKTLTSPTINTPTITAAAITGITSLTIANDIDVGNFQIRAKQFYADVPTGTAPFLVDSTTKVTNLNAEQADGYDFDQDVRIAASPTFAGATLGNAGLKLKDTDASHTLTVAPGSNLTANRTFTLATGDADRTLTLNGNPTLNDWFDQSVKTTDSPTLVRLTLSQAGGTSPLVVTSTTVVTNLNADLLDGTHGSSFVQTSRNVNTTSPLAGGGNLGGDLTLTLAGLTTLGTANYVVGANATAVAWEYKQILGTASEIDITHAAGSITIGLVNPLAVTKGGTGLATVPINTLLYASALDTLAALATANSGVLVTSGAGVPSIATDIPTAVTIGGQYAYRVGGTDVAIADGGTGASTKAAAFDALSPLTTQGDLLYGGVTGTGTRLGVGAVGKVLRSDGTNPLYSTFTIPDTMAINTLLYASAANVLSALATANSGMLVTSGAGVPSIATDIPTAVTIGGQYVHRVGGTDVVVADGGTGVSSLTAYAVLCGGTTSTGPIQSIAGVGTSGQVLTSNGAGALPTFQAAAGGTAEIKQVSVATPGTSNYTTTSTSFVDIDTTNLAITQTVAANEWVLILVSIRATACGTVGGDVVITLVEDGTDLAPSGNGMVWEDVTIADSYRSIMFFSLRQPSAAAHTWKLQWKATAGTNTIIMSANPLSDLRFAVIRFIPG